MSNDSNWQACHGSLPAHTRSFASFNYSLDALRRSEGINRLLGFSQCAGTHAINSCCLTRYREPSFQCRRCQNRLSSALVSSSFCTLVNLVIVDRNSDGTDIARARCRILVSILHTYQSYAIGVLGLSVLDINTSYVCREQYEAQSHWYSLQSLEWNLILKSDKNSQLN